MGRIDFVHPGMQAGYGLPLLIEGNGMIRLVRLIDRLNETIGKIVAWGILAMVLLQLAIVISRYVFASNSIFFLPSIWLQEGVVYLHGATIMLAAAYTFLYDGHVRIDVFRLKQTPRQRDWTDLLGCVVFLLPLCAIIAWSSLPNVEIAWATHEGSIEPNGLPFRYLLKTTILAFAILVGLQAVSTALKAAISLTGRQDIALFKSADTL